MPSPDVRTIGHATRFKPGVSGHPEGKPKGTKHLSTWIQELLNDEEFTLENFMNNGKAYKGAPMAAILNVAMLQAMAGEVKWADLLFKYGYGAKNELTISGEVKHMVTNQAVADEFEDYLKRKTVTIEVSESNTDKRANS